MRIFLVTHEDYSVTVVQDVDSSGIVMAILKHGDCSIIDLEEERFATELTTSGKIDWKDIEPEDVEKYNPAEEEEGEDDDTED